MNNEIVTPEEMARYGYVLHTLTSGDLKLGAAYDDIIKVLKSRKLLTDSLTLTTEVGCYVRYYLNHK